MALALERDGDMLDPRPVLDLLEQEQVELNDE
jgi:hypothetical protein